MSCFNRINRKHADLNWVLTMAQNTANLTGITQIVYERQCSIGKVYYFSDNWKGESIARIKPVQLTGLVADKNILSNTQNRERKSPKQVKSTSRQIDTSKDLEQTT